MNIENFIVIDAKDSLQKERKQFHYTANGSLYFPLETSIPVIEKGKGCIGIGFITEIRVRKSSTTIYFTLNKTSKEYAIAYYALYQNQLTSKGTEDPYDDTDVIIPGMMTSVPSMNKSAKSYDRRNERSHSSLSDCLSSNLSNDEIHW